MAEENPTEAIASPFLLFVVAVRPLKTASSEKSNQGNTCDTGKSLPSSGTARSCGDLLGQTRNRPLKRWISRDPFGEKAGINLYTYVLNSPVKFRDALGLILSDEEIANIVFNETRSISGDGIDEARKEVAHAIINGDSRESSGKGKRPKTAGTKVKIQKSEQKIYDQCKDATEDARVDVMNSVDPTNGAIHFNLRDDDNVKPFQGHQNRTQNGPFDNSYPTDDLPDEGIYINTYE